MKYTKVDWPEIQDYMGNLDFETECYFDPKKNVWFIPEWWEVEYQLENDWTGCDIGDLDDAMG